jgi:hypothetical protein
MSREYTKFISPDENVFCQTSNICHCLNPTTIEEEIESVIC